MSTEQATQFKPKPFRSDKQQSDSSYKEYSGFSHAYNVEPITYRPTEAHTGQFSVSNVIGVKIPQKLLITIYRAP